MSELRIEVQGDPQPQGSMVSFYDPRTKRIVTKSDNPRLKSWRQLVALKARLAVRNTAPVGKGRAVKLSIEFRIERPASVSVRERELPCVKPDLDKLTRAVCDALTGVVYEDDGQVCGYFEPYCKRYCKPGEVPGVTIRVALCESAQKTLVEV